MKTLLRRLLYTVGGLLALLVLFHLVENWRGRRAWAAWEKEQKAAGIPFDRASFAPPVIPDSENFMAAPRIAAAAMGSEGLLRLPGNWPEGPKVGRWQEARRTDLEAFRAAFPEGDLKKGLESYRLVLDDIVQAAQRPGSRLSIDYARFPVYQVPNLLGFRAAGRMLQLRALVALKEGRSEAALRDVSALLHMVQHLEHEPILLCQLLQIALANIAMQPIWEGLQTHAWTNAQLDSLQQELTKVDFLASINRSWKLEKAGMSELRREVAEEPLWAWTPYPSSSLEGTERPGRLMALLRHLSIPRGWILQNAVRGARVIQKTVSDPLDIANHRIDPARQDAAEKTFPKTNRSPYTFLVSDLGPVLAAQNVRAARIQVGFIQAQIACDLERRHQAMQAYPGQLSELGTAAPGDVIGGKALQYRRTDDGGYILYSLGWNGTDEGGQLGLGENAIREGDWAWSIKGTSASH